ncbi:uncharacterized protein V1516DRAFT_669334 [Lipomyces oligophaga]|uniref:uncharacterized protein n=1 Tax=Lipomyces oligophaga TaxID=45792 RepID=UPI0034CEAB13
MAAEQRKLLEQLMGVDALVGRASKRPEISLTDPKVCKSFLVGSCPHDLFTNTKQDLGACPKIHSEVLKAEYERAIQSGREFSSFEADYFKDLDKYILDCTRRIDAAQRRLERTPDEVAQATALLKAIDSINDSIDAHILELSVLGDLSYVPRALQAYQQLKIRRHDRAAKEHDLRVLNDNIGPSGHQKLQVCDVCGAYLSRLDNDRRLADHFTGKMHLGYAFMRAKHHELQERMVSRGARSRDSDRSAGRSSRRRDRERDSDRDRDRERDYNYDRDRERERDKELIREKGRDNSRPDGRWRRSIRPY